MTWGQAPAPGLSEVISRGWIASIYRPFIIKVYDTDGLCLHLSTSSPNTLTECSPCAVLASALTGIRTLFSQILRKQRDVLRRWLQGGRDQGL